MNMVNMNRIAHAITLAEGKKKEVSIAQIKEVLGIVSELLYLDHSFVVLRCMVACGARRQKAKQKKRKGKRK